jgi:hypothetical protein
MSNHSGIWVSLPVSLSTTCITIFGRCSSAILCLGISNLILRYLPKYSYCNLQGNVGSLTVHSPNCFIPFFSSLLWLVFVFFSSYVPLMLRFFFPQPNLTYPLFLSKMFVLAFYIVFLDPFVIYMSLFFVILLLLKLLHLRFLG